ncbi:regulator of (H+)-ATPase in vacuolar membrane [Malassezia cuniculi]|uniref:Regulator of (H+)-ATPase in vacuolar membrane n=1 Tax=Malassezia cuniculi TaxID=948313 RepID=A0AAF0J9R8_9BASI|nr:regulator of (H+)-ATPase in vacuolar membrane [Malassezia cuniculi]
MASLAPPGGDRVSCVALGYDQETGDMLLAAGSGTDVVLWRLKAAAPPSVQKVPVYSTWTLDGTVQVGVSVHSISLNERLAVGTRRGVVVYERVRLSWRPVWKTGSPRGILVVRWSPDALLLAALPAYDSRVAVWGGKDFTVAARLSHTRQVSTFSWRTSHLDDAQRPTLVTITTDSVARVFSTLPEAPLALRQVAAVDAAIEGDGPPCRTLSTVYIDSLHAHAAFRGDLLAALQQEQNAAAGVGKFDEDIARRAKRLTQLLRMPDFFLSVLADASLVVHAVGPLDAHAPTLIKTQVLLRIPMCLPLDAARTKMHLEFHSLPPRTDASNALVHAQSPAGAQGSLSLSPGYLFDGDMRGVVVRHDHARLLCAAHAEHVISLHTLGSQTISLSSDGHIIVWGEKLASQVAITVEGAVATSLTTDGFAVATNKLTYYSVADGDATRGESKLLGGNILDLVGDVAVTSQGISAKVPHKFAVEAATVSSDGRVYTVADEKLSEWTLGREWHTTASFSVGTVSRMVAHGRLVATTHSGTLSLWDMARCEFCAPLLLRCSVDGDPPLCWAADGRLLAVGAGADIDLYAHSSGTWRQVRRVAIPGARNISHIAALGSSLVVAYGCTIAVHALDSPPEPSRLLDDAEHLAHMLQFGVIDGADATLRVISAAGAKHASVPVDVVPLDTLIARKSSARMSQADVDRIGALLEDSPERLCAAQALWDVQRSELDDCAKRCLAAMRTSPGSGCTLWGAFSSAPEALVSAARLQHERFTWEAMRSTGVIYWAPQEALAELLDQAARIAFAKDEPDVILATVLYLAIGRLDTVRTLWKRAIGNADRQKMTNFLANDFSVERWRVAAQKNAFALISQRRFAFAAAFFLLGGAVTEAVNVCMRQLNDLSLAVAIARINGGTPLTKLLREHVVPAAIRKADRWLACWALYVLDRKADIIKTITRPLAALKEDDTFEFECEPPADDVQDPTLALLLEHARISGWGKLDDGVESRFVIHMQRQLAAHGYPIIGLALVRGWQFAAEPAHKPAPTQEDAPVSSTKVGLLFTNRAPPTMQSTQEFDMSAFGL